jgi:hypothetical protein
MVIFRMKSERGGKVKNVKKKGKRNKQKNTKQTNKKFQRYK